MITLQLETTSTCDAACGFCPYPTAERWGGLMKMDLYRKIIDEAATINKFSFLNLHGLGEPLLDPKLNDRLSYARDLMPEVTRCIYTNAVHLAKRLPGLIDAGLNRVVISLNAINAEQHENIMKLHGKWEQCVEGVDDSIVATVTSPGFTVEVHAVVSESYFTLKDAEQFIERWGNAKKSGYGLVIVEGNWAGEYESIRPFNPNERCHRAMEHIYVMYDGRISTCCFDPTGKQIMGDLNKETLREIYSRDPYLQFRQDHQDNKADLYPICKVCTRI